MTGKRVCFLNLADKQRYVRIGPNTFSMVPPKQMVVVFMVSLL